MRVFTVTGTQVQAGQELPRALPDNGYVWIACSRDSAASWSAQPDWGVLRAKTS